eukprot:TRINITY_DN2732_c0_g1_i1.p1 TRINITY_DN2732_c0_g1~~TRINITY_DN2732_c0_g1_i1.p1  ORF type:complete len:193 (+),score=42.41 TRINITY_DN2732_c0_g1_i1:66-581(+)
MALFDVGKEGGYKGSWFERSSVIVERMHANASKPGGFFDQSSGILERMHADTWRPGGFFDRSGPILEKMHKEASQPGGFFERSGPILEKMHKEASQPGGFFERSAPIVEKMHKEASTRQKVKGVKKDGKPDKRCNPKTLKAAAARFGERLTDTQMDAPGVLGKRYSKASEG